MNKVQYCVELYDKDNDYYEPIEYFTDEQQAYNLCHTLSSLIKRDMIINRFNSRTEPFDLVQVTERNTNKVLMVNDDLVLPF